MVMRHVAYFARVWYGAAAVGGGEGVWGVGRELEVSFCDNMSWLSLALYLPWVPT